MANDILGVNFKNNSAGVEHQWFPVEYFSGCDVTIYAGDVFLSEVCMLSFEMTEKVLPLFGYASFTADEVARGSRLVNGQFAIPFIEAGYLESVLSHIGENTTEESKVKPKLAFKKANETIPKWCSDYRMDVQGYFNKYNDETPTDDPLKDLKAQMPNGNLINGIELKGSYTITGGTAGSFIAGGSGKTYNVAENGVITVFRPDGTSKQIAPGQSGWSATKKAMEEDTKQTYASIKTTTAAKAAKQQGYRLLYSGGSGVFGTKLDSIDAFNERTSKYEREVWGRESSEDKDHRFQTYFYTDRERKNGKNNQEILKEKGFDIYITYGPMADAEKYHTWETKDTESPSLDTYSFRTTVKALRSIHLTTTGQTIQTDDNEILEVYSFIALDID